MSLRVRFAIALAVSAIVALIVAGVGALWSTQRALMSEADEVLLDRTGSFPADALEGLAAITSDNPVVVPFTEGRRLEDRFSPFSRRAGARPIIAPDLEFQMVDRNGNITVALEGSPRFEVPPNALEDDSPTLFNTTVDDTSYRVIVVPSSRGGALVAARDITEDVAAISALRRQIVSFGLLLVAAAAGAGWLIARRTVRPIEQLSAAADRVATTQDLSTPIPVSTDDEVGNLARSFNTMLSALQVSREQQHQLVMDASHELRTPLTSLRTNIEVLQRSDEIDDTDRADLLDDVTAELAELTSLVSELVELATDRRNEEPTVPVDLADLVATTVDRSRRRTGRTITVAADGSRVNGRPGQLDRAVWNLLENAAKWSPDGAPIEVTVANGSVTVRDHGPGIAEVDLPHVFERFYRADSARTRPGSGLGLAIVAQIIAGHGGRVSARNHPEGGAVVGFSTAEGGA